MKLFLHRVNDANNVINKTLLNGVEIDIKLKSDVSITSPEILLSNVDGVNYRDFNYAYVPELTRYYFINNIINVNNRMWKLELNCDVIETYKNYILASEAEYFKKVESGDFGIIRSESGFNDIDYIKSNIELDTTQSILLSTISVGN